MQVMRGWSACTEEVVGGAAIGRHWRHLWRENFIFFLPLEFRMKFVEALVCSPRWGRQLYRILVRGGPEQTKLVHKRLSQLIT